MTTPIDYRHPVRLSPRVRRVTQNNPGIFTGPGTNTHLVGAGALFILDPGEEGDDGHLERILAAVGDAEVVAVIPSHGHPDHWPLATRLARDCDAPIWFCGEHPRFRTDRSLSDGEVLEGDGVRLEVLYTPGHARDHLAFHLPAERALFPGDVVMGWSTSIISPPEGDLREYLRSLDRLAGIPDLAVAYPAHGVAIAEPYRRIAELRAHREERTRQALAALAAGPARIPELVARIYTDVDPVLHPAAARSLLAHLLALEADGRVERAAPGETEPTWRLRAG